MIRWVKTMALLGRMANTIEKIEAGGRAMKVTGPVVDGCNAARPRPRQAPPSHRPSGLCAPHHIDALQRMAIDLADGFTSAFGRARWSARAPGC